MARPLTIGTIFDSDLRLHWSWPLLPAGAAVYSLAVLPWREAVFSVLLLLAVYIVVLGHQGLQLLAARRFGLGTRDVTLYPFWGVARLTHMSDRPWQENYIAASGPVYFALVATAIAGAAPAAQQSLAFPETMAEPAAANFLVACFWTVIFLFGLHCLPVLPLDVGRIVHASISMRTSRLRATEIAAGLSTFGAMVMLLVAIFWLRSPLLGVTAVLLYFGAQEDLGTTRYFASLRHTSGDRPTPPAVLVPMEQIVIPDCRPEEPNFTGFTWNRRARLWVEWRDGQPVSANALIGDGRP